MALGSLGSWALALASSLLYCATSSSPRARACSSLRMESNFVVSMAFLSCRAKVRRTRTCRTEGRSGARSRRCEVGRVVRVFERHGRLRRWQVRRVTEAVEVLGEELAERPLVASRLEAVETVGADDLGFNDLAVEGRGAEEEAVARIADDSHRGEDTLLGSRLGVVVAWVPRDVVAVGVNGLLEVLNEVQRESLL